MSPVTAPTGVIREAPIARLVWPVVAGALLLSMWLGAVQSASAQDVRAVPQELRMQVADARLFCEQDTQALPESEVCQLETRLGSPMSADEGLWIATSLGTAAYKSKDWELAILRYREALEFAEVIGDEPQRIQLHRWVAAALRLVSRYPEAEKQLRLSLTLAEARSDVEAMLLAEADLGSLGTLRGRYGTALTHYRKSLHALRKHQDRLPQDSQAFREASLLTDIAETEVSAGRRDDIEVDFEHALRLLERAYTEEERRSQEARIRHQYGSALAKAGKHRPAVEQFRLALTPRLRVDSCEMRAAGITLNGLGYSLAQLERFDEALGVLDLALDLNLWAGDRSGESRTLDSLAFVYRQTARDDEALDHLLLALTLSQLIADLDAEYRSLLQFADIHHENKETELEILYLKRAVSVAERMRADLGRLPTYAQAFGESVVDTYWRLIDLLLSAERHGEAVPVIALRQRVLVGEFLQQMPLRSQGTDEEAEAGLEFSQFEDRVWNKQEDTIARLTDSVDSQRIVNEQLVAAECHIEFDARCEAIERKKLDIGKRVRKAREAFTAFSVRDDVKALRDLSDDVDLGNLHLLGGKLGPQDAIIYPLAFPDRIEVILVFKRVPPIRVVTNETLGAPELGALVERFRAQLSSPCSHPKPLAKELFDLLLRDISNKLRERKIARVFYVPDGKLRYIPFAALYDGKQWMAQRFTSVTVTAGSAQNLNFPREPIEDILAAATTRARTERGLYFPALAETEREIAAIGGAFRVLRKEDAAFTREYIEQGLVGFQVVHLATHAYLDPSGCDSDSFLLLGGKDTLSLADMQSSLALPNVELLVLSACQTGLGAPATVQACHGNAGRDGREIIGFGYLAQAKGAKSVLSSLWNVSDLGTRVLMERFYAHLAANLSVADSLRCAQLALIDRAAAPACLPAARDESHRQDQEELSALCSTSKTTGTHCRARRRTMLPSDPETALEGLEHPYYWASFFVMGSGE